MNERFNRELFVDFLQSAGFRQISESESALKDCSMLMISDISGLKVPITWILPNAGIEILSDSVRKKIFKNVIERTKRLQMINSSSLLFIIDSQCLGIYILTKNNSNKITILPFKYMKNSKNKKRNQLTNLDFLQDLNSYQTLRKLLTWVSALDLSHQQRDLIYSTLIMSSAYVEPNFRYNSQIIRTLFGLDSIFYVITSRYIETFCEKHPELYTQKFSEYLEIYRSIYGETNINDYLFQNHIYYLLFLHFFLNAQYPSIDSKKNATSKVIETNNEVTVHGLRSNIEWIFDIAEANEFLSDHIRRADIEKEDLFFQIYQNIVNLDRRQESGEVYTPKQLVQLMLDKKLPDQLSIMDPSCGSGSFIVGILKKLSYESESNQNMKIYAVDINPLAIRTIQANVYLFYRDDYSNNNQIRPKIQVFNDNALLPKLDPLIHLSEDKIDMIIGNPPWINISSITHKKEKQVVKQLATDLNILYGREAKNTEICTIFFNRCRDLYLHDKGTIFFVLPASVLNGHQHVYFRYFPGFSDIEVWKFDADIFRVHSVCLFAKYDKQLFVNKPTLSDDMERLTLKSVEFLIKDENGSMAPDREINFEKVKDSLLMPIYIKGYTKKKKYPRVGRFNSIEKTKKLPILITPEKSIYYKQVKGGLRIVPRRWLVVNERPPFDDIQSITPDLHQQAKKKWSQPPYKSLQVNSKDVRPFLKSQGLIPFHFANIEYGFIPIVDLNSINTRNSNDYFDFKKMARETQDAYRLVDEELQALKKPSASMKTLADNYTYNGRLLPTTIFYDEKRPFMVVHNSIGSIVKATVVHESIILDNSLYYFITEDENEAYYLTGILNSPIMTDHLQLIGSTGARGSLRNIHKNPYNFPIPQFESARLQLSISDLSKTAQEYVKFYIARSIDKKEAVDESSLVDFLLMVEEKIKVRTIQNRLFDDKKFKGILKDINENVIQLFRGI